ncbi:MAG TPA: ATP-binding protein [Candidatus Cloacimonadota bacterium]|nr:ATP-binding protein [Candidatus Cloacimonadota bacterium]
MLQTSINLINKIRKIRSTAYILMTLTFVLVGIILVNFINRQYTLAEIVDNIGRQRMLSQKLVNSLFILNHNMNHHPEQISLSTFTKDLNDFQNAHSYIAKVRSVGTYHFILNLKNINKEKKEVQTQYASFLKQLFSIRQSVFFQNKLISPDQEQKLIATQNLYVKAIDNLNQSISNTNKSFIRYNTISLLLLFFLQMIFMIGENFFIFYPVSKKLLSFLKNYAKTEDRYKKIFNQSSEAILLIQKGVICDFNQKTLDMHFLKHKADILNQEVDVVFPHIEQPEYKTTFKEQLMLSELQGTCQFNYLYTCNEKTFLADISLTHLKDFDENTHIALWHDVSEIRKMNETIKEREAFLRLIIDSSPNLIFVKDLNSRYLLANKALTDLYHISQEDIIGKTDYDFACNKEEANQFRQADIEVLNNKEAKIVNEETLTNQEGFTRYFYTIKIPLLDKKGDIFALLGVATDISEIKKAEQALREARQIAEQANKTKSEFLANMSHEIRTPMNAILGFSELIKSKNTDPQLKEWVDSIYHSGKNLLRLINDILDLSKIEAGKIDIQQNDIHLADLINEISSVFSYKIKEKALNLMIHIEKDIPDRLLLDEVRLRQILFNLTGNAVKYTNSGYIKISVSSEKHESMNTINLIIKIEDSGIGIKSENLDLIFEEFRQLKPGNQNFTGGTGLGLAISKKLSELMNGTLTVKSEIDQGSEFTLTFRNVTYLKEIKITENDTKLTNIQFLPAKILIADDVKSNRLLLKNMLSEFPFEIIEAEDGEEAVKKAISEKPDLIYIDMIMPSLSGSDALELLKNKQDTASIPVILITASAIEMKEYNYSDKPFDEILFKPIQMNELILSLKKFIRQSNGLSETFKNNISPYNHIDYHMLKDVICDLDLIYRQQWIEIKDSMLIDEIQDFADNMLILSRQSNVDFFINWSEKLIHEINQFDIVSVQFTLSQYPLILDNLKEMSELQE